MVQKLPKRTNLDIPAGTAQGAMFFPHTPQRGDPISASQLQAIAEAAARANQLNRSQPGMNLASFIATTPEIPQKVFYEGVLLDDLAASTDPLDDPVTATMQCIQPLMHKNSSDQAGLSFDSNSEIVTVTNRRTDFSASTGNYVFCIKVNGEIRPQGGGGGASCVDVRFQVLVADSVTRTALCVIVSRPYGCGIADIPDTIMDGTVIEVCDPAGCFFNDPNDELEGREGWAKYVTPIAGSTFCQDGSYEIVPEWQVYSLCCMTDRCNL